MENFDGHLLVSLNTIQFLASAKKACPEYLGQVSSVDEADAMSQAVFTMFVLEGQQIVRANPIRLMAIVKAVSVALKIELSREQLERVCAEVEEKIRIEYMEFINGWQEDLPGLIDGSITIH